MLPQTHFLFPFAIALALSKMNLISWKLAIICGLAGVLVDLDHYIEHILHAKANKFSFTAAWNNSIKLHRFNQRSFIHYGKGMLILTLIFLIILIFNWQISLILAIGYYSHLLLDFVYLRKDKYLRWKVGKLVVKESYSEIVLDVVLILGIVLMILW